MKYFRLTYDYILHDISYVNLIMLCKTIPDTSLTEEEKEEIETVVPTKDIQDLFG